MTTLPYLVGPNHLMTLVANAANRWTRGNRFCSGIVLAAVTLYGQPCQSASLAPRREFAPPTPHRGDSKRETAAGELFHGMLIGGNGVQTRDRAEGRQKGRRERVTAAESRVTQAPRRDANSGGSHYLPRCEGD